MADSVETAHAELRDAFASGLSHSLAWRSEVLGQIIQMFTEHWEEAKACQRVNECVSTSMHIAAAAAG